MSHWNKSQITPFDGFVMDLVLGDCISECFRQTHRAHAALIRNSSSQETVRKNVKRMSFVRPVWQAPAMQLKTPFLRWPDKDRVILAMTPPPPTDKITPWRSVMVTSV